MMIVLCDGESVNEGSLRACLADCFAETRDHLDWVSGPEICGQAARTGEVWRLKFATPSVFEALLVTDKFIQAVRKALAATSPNLAFERMFVGQIANDLNSLLKQIDYLKDGIRDSAVKLRKTRAMPGLGRKEIAEVRRELEALVD